METVCFPSSCAVEAILSRMKETRDARRGTNDMGGGKRLIHPRYILPELRFRKKCDSRR
jgi:hypothetical protein